MNAMEGYLSDAWLDILETIELLVAMSIHSSSNGSCSGNVAQGLGSCILDESQDNSERNSKGGHGVTSSATSSLPSQILPHLFVGAQEQTNPETIDRLDIKYILSLGLLPLAIQHQESQPRQNQQPKNQQSILHPPNSKATGARECFHSLPPTNCSRDFEISICSSGASSAPTSPSATVQDEQSNYNHNHHDPHEQQQRRAESESPEMEHQPQQQQVARNNESNDKASVAERARSIHCKCINISDNSEQMLSKFFDESFAFIEAAVRRKCNILIHCLVGVSRSPTIAIAYLMRVKSLNWREAYDMVKRCRPQIDPNLSFMGQLRIYNRSLFGERRRRSTTSDGSLPGSSRPSGSNDQLACGAAGEDCTIRVVLEQQQQQQQQQQLPSIGHDGLAVTSSTDLAP